MNEMQEIILLELLENHVGESNAIKREICGVKGSKLRGCINRLRRIGIPVCSGKSGYYLAGSVGEINATIKQLVYRVESIHNAIQGLYDARAIIAMSGATPKEYAESRLMCEMLCD